jgi:hypothetical protein
MPQQARCRHAIAKVPDGGIRPRGVFTDTRSQDCRQDLSPPLPGRRSYQARKTTGAARRPRGLYLWEPAATKSVTPAPPGASYRRVRAARSPPTARQQPRRRHRRRGRRHCNRRHPLHFRDVQLNRSHGPLGGPLYPSPGEGPGEGPGEAGSVTRPGSFGHRDGPVQG